MSRFVEILHREREISVESFGSLLTEMTERSRPTPAASRCRSRISS